MNEFDPYLAWLDIPPHHRPAQPWRLLRVSPDCRNPSTIQNAAQASIDRVQQASQGQHQSWESQLVTEIRQAEQSLLQAINQPSPPVGGQVPAEPTSDLANPHELPLPPPSTGVSGGHDATAEPKPRQEVSLSPPTNPSSPQLLPPPEPPHQTPARTAQPERQMGHPIAPPTTKPPVATPPVATPPVASPPVTTPPLATPPLATPPVATPQLAVGQTVVPSAPAPLVRGVPIKAPIETEVVGPPLASAAHETAQPITALPVGLSIEQRDGKSPDAADVEPTAASPIVIAAVSITCFVLGLLLMLLFVWMS